MVEKEKGKKLISNTVYTMGGAFLMNGFLQLLIYPLLNRYMGSDQMGVLLYLMGLVAILCPSVGQALNNNRLVVRRDAEITNGDYNRLLMLFGGIGTIVVLIIAWKSFSAPMEIFLTAALLMTTVFRYYGDVEYRLNLNYKQYFIYYAVLTAGYGVGFIFYFITGVWFWIFLTGEVAALVYLAITGTVFREFWKASPFFLQAFRRGGFLVFSYLITNFTLNIDRLVLKIFIGDLAVTQYYVTSLIGKTMVLLVAPINTIIISYLTKRKENMNRKQFLLFAGAGLCGSLGFFLFAQIGTPLFVRLFYADLYESVRPLISIVNLSQVLGLFSVYLFVIILTFTEEKWQLILQMLHLILIAVLTVILTTRMGIMGFSLALLAANAFRVAAVLVLGLLKVNR